jgi:hypothetical protein
MPDTVTKLWYESRTLWIGVLVFLGALLGVTGVADLPIDPTAEWVVMGLSIIQVLLRLITKTEITLKIK